MTAIYLFFGRLKNPKDRDLAVAAIARSEKAFCYVQVANRMSVCSELNGQHLSRMAARD